MGLGTWAWGNQLLWGYDKSMDAELQQLFNLMVSKGINIFDTADSYGMRHNISLQKLYNLALTPYIVPQESSASAYACAYTKSHGILLPVPHSFCWQFLLKCLQSA